MEIDITGFDEEPEGQQIDTTGFDEPEAKKIDISGFDSTADDGGIDISGFDNEDPSTGDIVKGVGAEVVSGGVGSVAGGLIGGAALSVNDFTFVFQVL